MEGVQCSVPGGSQFLIVLRWQRGVEKVAAIAIRNWTFGVAVLLTLRFSSISLHVLTSLCGGTSPYSCTEYTTTYSMPIKPILPEQTSYQFNYQNNSELALTEITLPTGGTIPYSTATAGTFQPDQGQHPTPIQRPSVASRTVGSGGTNSQWTYSGTGSNSVTVTDPAGNRQVLQYSKLTIGSNCSAMFCEVSRELEGAGSNGFLERHFSLT